MHVTTTASPRSSASRHHPDEVDGAVGGAAVKQGIFINEVAAQAADPGDSVVVSSQSGVSFSLWRRARLLRPGRAS